jgi:hypothetical protein
MFKSIERALTNGRDSGDDLTKFELVEDGSFASSVQANHQNSHLPGAEKGGK